MSCQLMRFALIPQAASKDSLDWEPNVEKGVEKQKSESALTYCVLYE